MTDIRRIPLDQVRLGQKVSVEQLTGFYAGCGQGGVVAALTPDVVITGPDGTDHRYDRSRFGTDLGVDVEVPTDASECVEFGPDCSGEVEWFDPSGRGRGAQRCAHHRDLRAERYQNGIEAYAHSASVPSWFDPAYAGESWDEV